MELAIEECATRKSAFPSVVMHSGARDPHSLFWIWYAPPLTGRTWVRHSVVVVAVLVTPEEHAVVRVPEHQHGRERTGTPARGHVTSRPTW